MAHKKFNKSNAKPPKTKEDPGGERVSVTITVNEKISFTRSAVLEKNKNNGASDYKTDDSDTIKHNRDQGSKSLAEKLIKK